MEETTTTTTNIAKVSVESYDKSETNLYDFDKSKTLKKIIHEIITQFSLPESKSYGLKCFQRSGHSFYVLNSNIKDVQTGDSLKLVLSIDTVVENIFKLMNCQDTRSEMFNLMKANCTDKAFIIELYNTNRINQILDIYIKDDLIEPENCACLLTIIHAFQLGYISNIDRDFLSKTIDIVKEQRQPTSEQVQYSLSLLYHILISKNTNFRSWKEQIIKSTAITQLMQLIRNENNLEVQPVQFNALQLINTIIRLCKGDQRQQYIREMNQRQNRWTIYESIIKKIHGLDEAMQHQLYVCQTLILSLYKDSLELSISIDDNKLFKRDEFDLPCEQFDSHRSQYFVGFEDDSNTIIIPEQLNIDNKGSPVGDTDFRYSMSSIKSDFMTEGEEEEDEDSASRNSFIANESISYLTLEALRYFKKAHYKCFHQSQLEEKLYAPGIFTSSERVVRILAKLLHINRNPISKCTLYQPMVFFCPAKKPFFNELFSRTMWLLSKTRREMKASTPSDFDKVMHALEKQVQIVLATKPMDFKKLTEEMTNISFEIVSNQWMVEKQQAFEKLITTNSAIIQLREKLRKDNMEVINRQRLKVLIAGGRFPYVTEKKINSSLKLVCKLSDNLKKISITAQDIQHYDVTDITHIITGNNCPHVSLLKNKKPNMAFSILFNHTTYVNFIASSQSEADKWLDGLNILLGKDKRSELYHQELNMLIDIDLRLQLMELENVSIPMQAPPVPRYPSNARPVPPPKPKNVSSKEGKHPKN